MSVPLSCRTTGPVGISRLEALDRGGAAPGMDRDHQVGRPAVIVASDAHAMAELAQDARPARGGDAVAGA